MLHVEINIILIYFISNMISILDNLILYINQIIYYSYFIRRRLVLRKIRFDYIIKLYKIYLFYFIFYFIYMQC